jgi:hypothetical protein
LHELRPEVRTKAETREEYRQRIIRGLCELFQEDNPHFKPDRFRAVSDGQPSSTRRNGPAMPYVRNC